MTPTQKKILTFIQTFINEHDYSPSFVEIARGVGLSPTSLSLVSRSIHALVKAGHLKFHKTGYRNLQLASLTEAKSEGLTLPLIGRIAAGSPIEAIEDQQSLNLSAFLTSNDHFLLKVQGDSMVGEGILDGDLVICKHATNAHEGEIVVALIDQHEATLKRISFKIHERITLVPANPNLKPKAYLPHRVLVQGVFIGLLRLRA